MRKSFALYIALLVLSGCSVSDLPFVYHPDLQQGTVLTEADVNRLQVGMTREQVRFILGTPTLDDPFHKDRWDYVYELIPGDGAKRERHHLTVFFKNDRLARAKGDFVPAGSRLAAGE
ncbi:MAG: outer membrane protein assembly factor BamE [Ectothiorhodospiraceae bacterium]